MPSKYHNPEESNRRYQRALAHALVSGLGREAACEACAQNGWEGVVKILLPPRCRSNDAAPNDVVPSNMATAAA
jgi:hypothetical protein